ncbi:hypothetical protein BAU15_03505 [Enterococcus sp. JM4C]|uniref:ArnT family glycosyltransferase n=1 Tax=Candidatus Enterococcus huntleyi TaxID=1857217 RepID=UPI0013796A15|nr:glycosyltransferase family 39 protein [Enterococcus sp. JM4C]KAF1295619.1 hypothetical protein BAU15_03505 [Enterococcus sp. JM4C]
MNRFFSTSDESPILVRLAKYFLLSVTALFFLGIAIISLFYFNAGYLPFELTIIGSVLLVLITLLGVLLLGFLLIQLRSKIHSVALLLGVAFLLRLLWILLVQTEPEQDFLKMYQAALRFSEGDFGFMTDSRYFVVSPYQLGFVLYEGLLIKIIGPSVIGLKLINVIVSTVTVYMTYIIGQRIFDKKVALLSGWFVALYIPNIVLTSVLTNQIIALFIFLAAIYLFLRNNRWFPVVGFLLFIGNLTRPLASILLIAFLLYGLFFQLPSQKKKLTYLILLATIPLTFFVSGKLTDQVLLASDITEVPISTVNPYWKLALGLNLETEGHWNREDYQTVNTLETQVQRDAAAKKLIHQRTKNPGDLAKLMVKKFKRMWNDFDSSISWATDFKEHFLLKKLLLFLGQKIQYYFLILGAFFFILKPSNKKAALFLLLIIIFGYALVHQIVEIQTRYRYFITPFVALLSAGFWLSYTPGNLWQSLRSKNSDQLAKEADQP